jgi:hypothetical protein
VKKILVDDYDELPFDIARELLEEDQIDVITLHCGFSALELEKVPQLDLGEPLPCTRSMQYWTILSLRI